MVSNVTFEGYQESIREFFDEISQINDYQSGFVGFINMKTSLL